MQYRGLDVTKPKEGYVYITSGLSDSRLHGNDLFLFACQRIGGCGET